MGGDLNKLQQMAQEGQLYIDGVAVQQVVGATANTINYICSNGLKSGNSFRGEFRTFPESK